MPERFQFEKTLSLPMTSTNLQTRISLASNEEYLKSLDRWAEEAERTRNMAAVALLLGREAKQQPSGKESRLINFFLSEIENMDSVSAILALRAVLLMGGNRLVKHHTRIAKMLESRLQLDVEYACCYALAPSLLSSQQQPAQWNKTWERMCQAMQESLSKHDARGFHAVSCGIITSMNGDGRKFGFNLRPGELVHVCAQAATMDISFCTDALHVISKLADCTGRLTLTWGNQCCDMVTSCLERFGEDPRVAQASLYCASHLVMAWGGGVLHRLLIPVKTAASLLATSSDPGLMKECLELLNHFYLQQPILIASFDCAEHFQDKILIAATKFCDDSQFATGMRVSFMQLVGSHVHCLIGRSSAYESLEKLLSILRLVSTRRNEEGTVRNAARSSLLKVSALAQKQASPPNNLTTILHHPPVPPEHLSFRQPDEPSLESKQEQVLPKQTPDPVVNESKAQATEESLELEVVEPESTREVSADLPHSEQTEQDRAEENQETGPKRQRIHGVRPSEEEEDDEEDGESDAASSSSSVLEPVL